MRNGGLPTREADTEFAAACGCSVPVAAVHAVAAQRQVNAGNRPTTQRNGSRRISNLEALARRETCRSLSSQQTSIQDLARRGVERGKAIFMRTEMTPQSTPWGISVVPDIVSSRAEPGATARGPRPVRSRWSTAPSFLLKNGVNRQSHRPKGGLHGSCRPSRTCRCRCDRVNIEQAITAVLCLEATHATFTAYRIS